MMTPRMCSPRGRQFLPAVGLQPLALESTLRHFKIKCRVLENRLRAAPRLSPKVLYDLGTPDTGCVNQKAQKIHEFSDVVTVSGLVFSRHRRQDTAGGNQMSIGTFSFFDVLFDSPALEFRKCPGDREQQRKPNYYGGNFFQHVLKCVPMEESVHQPGPTKDNESPYPLEYVHDIMPPISPRVTPWRK